MNQIAMRALLALYRNYPNTPPGLRYSWQAHRAAHAEAEKLLAWAETQSDDTLLACRNLGRKSLAWIRANRPGTVRVRTEAGQWLLAEYARTPGDPKWHPGLGLDSTIIVIEAQAASLERRRIAALVRGKMETGDWDATYSAEPGVLFDSLLGGLEGDRD